MTPEEFRLFEPCADQVPDMVKAGDGYRFHVTGLTHDERGYPSMNVETQDRAVRRMQTSWIRCPDRGRSSKPRPGRCGSSGGVLRNHLARGAAGASNWRGEGIRAGKFRLIIGVALPGGAHRRTGGPSEGVRGAGIEPGTDGTRSGAGRGRKSGGDSGDHAGGTVHDPEAILKAIVEAAR